MKLHFACLFLSLALVATSYPSSEWEGRPAAESLIERPGSDTVLGSSGPEEEEEGGLTDEQLVRVLEAILESDEISFEEKIEVLQEIQAELGVDLSGVLEELLLEQYPAYDQVYDNPEPLYREPSEAELENWWNNFRDLYEDDEPTELKRDDEEQEDEEEMEEEEEKEIEDENEEETEQEEEEEEEQEDENEEEEDENSEEVEEFEPQTREEEEFFEELEKLSPRELASFFDQVLRMEEEERRQEEAKREYLEELREERKGNYFNEHLAPPRKRTSEREEMMEEDADQDLDHINSESATISGYGDEEALEAAEQEEEEPELVQAEEDEVEKAEEPEQYEQEAEDEAEEELEEAEESGDHSQENKAFEEKLLNFLESMQM